MPGCIYIYSRFYTVSAVLMVPLPRCRSGAAPLPQCSNYNKLHPATSTTGTTGTIVTSTATLASGHEVRGDSPSAAVHDVDGGHYDNLVICRVRRVSCPLCASRVYLGTITHSDTVPLSLLLLTLMWLAKILKAAHWL